MYIKMYINTYEEAAKENKNVKTNEKEKTPKVSFLGRSFNEALPIFCGRTLLKMKRFEISHIRSVRYMGGWEHTDSLPVYEIPEIAFFGRSNVGKSSMLNALFSHIKSNLKHEKAKKKDTVAPVSKTPGRTQKINVYKLQNANDEDLIALVDLPGYGFTSSISKLHKQKMQSFLNAYIHRRREIRLVILLIDLRLDNPMSMDLSNLNSLKKIKIPFLVVGTKADSVNTLELEKKLNTFREILALPEWQPIPFSSFTRLNINLIWRIIRDASINNYVTGVYAEDMEIEDDPEKQKDDLEYEKPEKLNMTSESGQLCNDEQMRNILLLNPEHVPHLTKDQIKTANRHVLLEYLEDFADAIARKNVTNVKM